MTSESRLITLDRVEPEQGACWCAPLPETTAPGDSVETPARSILRLFEDERELGPGHSAHEDIRRHGGGRFSHWGRTLLFASSDGSPPRCNGRTYRALVSLEEPDPRRAIVEEVLGLDLATIGAERRYALGERLFSLLVPEVKLSEFGRSFFQDTAFRDAYERFDRSNYHSYDRKFAARELLNLALDLPGDLAECGVFQGATAYILATALRAAGSDKTLHLFDSFAGLSAPGPRDGEYWEAGSLSCGLDTVARNLDPVRDTVCFHPGWIPTAFDAVADRRFCFVHIDVDLYEPTRDAVAFFYPRLVPGGLLLCDDYGFDTCPGARRAMDEFFANERERIVHLPTGQGFVIRHRA